MSFTFSCENLIIQRYEVFRIICTICYDDVMEFSTTKKNISNILNEPPDLAND